MSSQLHSSDALLPGKEPLVPFAGGWVGPIDGLDALVRRENPSTYRESNPELRI
jgi:hypothetical protein